MTSPTLRLCRKGAVSVIFATAIIPLLMTVGLAIDYGFYNEADAQLQMAADAAAIHAARIASELVQKYGSDYIPQAQAAGEVAAEQWFKDQLGIVPQSKAINLQTPVVKFDTTGKTVTASVNFSGIIITNFGNLFPKSIPTWPNWPIAGQATAVITIPAHVEILMLLDNSSSMLIGDTEADIQAMETITPCSSESANEGQPFDNNYSWVYSTTYDAINNNVTAPPYSAYSTTQAANAPPNVFNIYGFGTFFYLSQAKPPGKPTNLYEQEIVPPPLGGKVTQPIGNCDPRFTGPASECQYPGTLLQSSIYTSPASPNYGQCLNGKGGNGVQTVDIINVIPAVGPYATNPPAPLTHMPQAPCSFACHNNPGADYYALARTNPSIVLRYDEVQTAAASVISTLSSQSDPNQFTVGVYQFNAPPYNQSVGNVLTGLSQVYPNSVAVSPNNPPAQEAGPISTTAENDTKNVQPPLTDDQPDTNFEYAMSLLSSFVKPAGTGDTAGTAQKDLFIVTDGMDDYYDLITGQRVQGQINNVPGAPNYCDALKKQGFSIYVVYTKYYPLPNPYYLSNDATKAEPPPGSPPGTYSPIEAAMEACSSGPDYFLPADGGEVGPALQTLLQKALGSPGRLSN